MEIINVTELASYLRESDLDGSAALHVELANGIVSEVIGDLDPLPVRVKAITLEVAARAYRNPEGWASEAIDDWSGRRSNATADGGVYLTPWERSDLLRLVGGGSSVRSVRLIRAGEE